MAKTSRSIFMHTATQRRHRRALPFGATALVLAGCAGGVPGGAPIETPEAEWRALAVPRPDPLPGAARVSVTEVQLVGAVDWRGMDPPLAPGLAVEELVVAGLLRRPDVRFVERRRFTDAAAAERAGIERPRGAPAAGVSPGAEYLATATWVSLPADRGTVELRLTDARTASVVTAHRATLVGEVGPVVLARAIVDAIVGALERIDRHPEWADPLAGPGGSSRGAEVPESAVLSFLYGVAAENAWNWEEARRRYQAAAGEARFHEASAALARAARLRLGGTLGES